MSERIVKVNKLIKKELGEIINREIDFPKGILATITKVEVFRDLSWAKVYLSVLPSSRQSEVLKILRSQASELFRLLNRKVVLKSVPKLTFLSDDSLDKAEEIDFLLDNLKNSG